MNEVPQTKFMRTDKVLHGESIYIRSPRYDELSFIRMLWADPETMAPVGGTHQFPEAEARSFFERMVDPGDSKNCYCLIFNQEDAPVGEISFHRWIQRERSAELNIKVHALHRGHGYGTDALRTFLGWFFGEAGGSKMTDNVALDNKDGQHLLQLMGFHRDTDYSDTCMLFITREMYTSKYGVLKEKR